MKVQQLTIDKLVTERLLLIPFTIEICRTILDNTFADLEILNLKKGKELARQRRNGNLA